MITRDHARGALAAIKSAADAEFFFDNLKSPEWIKPLVEEGFFASPPAAIHDGGTIGFPFWPQSRYLVRMAPSAPQETLSAVLAIPETDNARVHEDLVDAVLAMPPQMAVQITERVVTWL